MCGVGHVSSPSEGWCEARRGVLNKLDLLCQDRIFFFFFFLWYFVETEKTKKTKKNEGNGGEKGDESGGLI